jgi:hypothetical protein
MNKIEISVTVSRTDIKDQFKGSITLKNGLNEVKFNYLCTDPDEDVNVEFSEFSNGIEGFKLNGFPSKELFETLKENQKLIFAMSVNSLSEAISNTQDLSLSHEDIQILRMFGSDASGEINRTIEVGDKEYSSLFGGR